MTSSLFLILVIWPLVILVLDGILMSHMLRKTEEKPKDKND